jgi:hypothetical protein
VEAEKRSWPHAAMCGCKPHFCSLGFSSFSAFKGAQLCLTLTLFSAFSLVLFDATLAHIAASQFFKIVQSMERWEN